MHPTKDRHPVFILWPFYDFRLIKNSVFPLTRCQPPPHSSLDRFGAQFYDSGRNTRNSGDDDGNDRENSSFRRHSTIYLLPTGMSSHFSTTIHSGWIKSTWTGLVGILLSLHAIPFHSSNVLPIVRGQISIYLWAQQLPCATRILFCLPPLVVVLVLCSSFVTVSVCIRGGIENK